MKKLLLFAAVALLLVGCAKTNKDFQFVPLQISWHSADGVDTETQYVSSCMVKVTNALMQNEVVQKHAADNVSYEAEIVSKGEGQGIAFTGACAADAVVSEDVCSWSAECDTQGEVTNLKMGK